MYDTSPGFQRALRGSHTAAFRLDATRGDKTTPLEVLDGTVTVNYDDPIRRSLDVTLADPGDLGDLETLLDPLVTTLTPYRGLEVGDSEEMVPLGVFHPTELTLGEADGGPTYSLRAYDAAVRCQEDLASPYFMAAGTPLHEAIPPLLTRKLPTLAFRLTPTAFTTPALLVRTGKSPWTNARELMTAAGFDLTIDRDGVCVSKPRTVSADPTPVWSFVEGETADFWKPARALGNDAFPNVVVVVGTNASNGAEVRGEAADMDPASPTYRYGAYGEHVRTIQSERVRSAAQAAVMAQGLLGRLLGPQDEVTFSAVANPALDVGDTIAVTRERIGLDAHRMIVSEVRLPLSATAPMLVTARRSVITDAAGTPEPA